MVDNRKLSSIASSTNIASVILHVPVASSELGRRSSTVLLHVALAPSVAAPDTLLTALEGMADTLVLSFKILPLIRSSNVVSIKRTVGASAVCCIEWIYHENEVEVST